MLVSIYQNIMFVKSLRDCLRDSITLIMLCVASSITTNLLDYKMFSKFSLDKYSNSKNYGLNNKDYLERLIQTYKTKCLKISSNLNEDLTLLEMKNSINIRVIS